MNEALVVGLLILVIAVQLETRVKVARLCQRIQDHVDLINGHKEK